MTIPGRIADRRDKKCFRKWGDERAVGFGPPAQVGGHRESSRGPKRSAPSMMTVRTPLFSMRSSVEPRDAVDNRSV